MTGQDGQYLSRALVAQGERVVGTTTAIEKRRMEDVELFQLDLSDVERVRAIIAEVRPDRVYHLAAMSSVADAWREPLLCAQVNALGTIALITAMGQLVPNARLINASSSEIYAASLDGKLTEDSPFGPRNPYGAAKLHAHLAVQQARVANTLFAANAVLFAHESPLRPPTFVSRKITATLARIASGKDDVLLLGNVDVERDWGHAEDVVEALIKIGNAEAADDFIVATGQRMSVRRFVEVAAEAVGLPVEWEGEGLNLLGVSRGRRIVTIDERLIRPVEAPAAWGDSSRIAGRLGWFARYSGADVAREMMEAERLSPLR